MLLPGVDALRDREAQRDKTGYDDGWSVQDYHTEFASTTPRLGLWIDSSAQTAEETVAEILARALTDAAV